MKVHVVWASTLPGLDKSEPYSFEGPQHTSPLTGVVGSGILRHPKRVFFVNMMTALLLLGLVGKRNRLFRVGGTNPRPFSDP